MGWEYIFYKDETHILSVFHWEITCGEDLDEILTQVFPWRGFFITRFD